MKTPMVELTEILKRSEQLTILALRLESLLNKSLDLLPDSEEKSIIEIELMNTTVLYSVGKLKADIDK